jgi:hypothetical protein
MVFTQSDGSRVSSWIRLEREKDTKRNVLSYLEGFGITILNSDLEKELSGIMPDC